MTLVNGYAFDSELFGTDGVMPLVRIRDLAARELSTFVSGTIPPDVILRDGDLVVGMDGDFDIVVWRRGPAALNQRLCLLRPRPGVDPRFIAYALPAHLEVINDLTYSTTVKHLSSFEVLAERVTCPSYEEQRAIADYLDAETARLDQIVARRRELMVKLDEREFSFLSFTLVPNGVRFLPLGRRASIQAGLTVDAQRDAGPDSVTRPYLRVANVQPGWLELESVTDISVPRVLANRCTLRPGDVLMTEGGDLDKLGRGTVWRGELPDALHQNHVFAVRPEQGVLDFEYLALLTRTAHARAYFESTGTRTTNLASTNSEKILDLPVPHIEVGHQQELVSRARQWLDQSSQLRRALHTQSRLLRERRQALVTAAVTGQLAIPGVAA